MGVGLPYAMAAKLAFPDQQVVCITGEASIRDVYSGTFNL